MPKVMEVVLMSRKLKLLHLVSLGYLHILIVVILLIWGAGRQSITLIRRKSYGIKLLSAEHLLSR